ncbi:MAG: acyl-protein synthetase, partial [Clostridia bacterium]
MITLEDYMELEPFSLEISLKEPIIFSFLKNLTKHHNENCLEYNKLLKSLDLNINEINSIEKLPYLPVRLFKNLNLKSFDYSDLKTTLYSSGTTGQTSSKIYLDNITERNQRKILVNIVKDFIGRERLPMIILDCRSSVYTSRSTGITGFLPFGKENIFALNEDMSLNLDIINMFLEKHKNKKILLFGSTYLIYSSFYKELLRLNKKLDLSNHILIHG